MLMQDQEDDDQDSIKQALLETNPILLGKIYNHTIVSVKWSDS